MDSSPQTSMIDQLPLNIITRRARDLSNDLWARTPDDDLSRVQDIDYAGLLRAIDRLAW